MHGEKNTNKMKVVRTRKNEEGCVRNATAAEVPNGNKRKLQAIKIQFNLRLVRHKKERRRGQEYEETKTKKVVSKELLAYIERWLFPCTCMYISQLAQDPLAFWLLANWLATLPQQQKMGTQQCNMLLGEQ